MKAENIIRTLWLARASAQCTPQEEEMLADEAWSLGLHLTVHPHVHYQHVRNLVRWALMK